MLHCIPPGILSFTTGYIIEGSATLDVNEFLHFTPGSAGNRRTFSIHMILKNNGGGSGLFSADNGGHIDSGDGLGATNIHGLGSNGPSIGDYASGWNFIVSGASRMRDFSSWYDYLIVYDSTQATAANRIKIYINGVEVSYTGSSAYPGENAQYSIGNTVEHNIGAWVDRSGFIGGFQLARFAWVDGAALTPAAFGETSDDGFWQINEANVDTWGDLGVLLEGGSNIAAGTDTSGEGNDWGRSATLTATKDSPTNGGDGYGNYCTWNPLQHSASATFASNNLKATVANSQAEIAVGTIAVSSGKFYWEVEAITGFSDASGGSGGMIGISGVGKLDAHSSTRAYNQNDQLGMYFYDGNTYSGDLGSGSYGSAYADDAVIGVALDMDNGAIYFSKDGTWQNSATASQIAAGTTTNAASTSLTNAYTPALFGAGGNTPVAILRTSEDDWTGSAPTGFKALSTANLSTPAVINPDDHFFSTIIDHDGSDTDGTCTFNLDTYEWLAIIKNTTGAVEKWYWIDSLRGVTKYWSSTDSSAQTTDSNVLTVSGTTFTLGSTLGAKNYLVEFHRAGLASATASNTVGTINTAATSVNTTSGFAIGQYEGTGANATVGHGLSSTPEFTIHKGVDNAENSVSWHTGLTDGTYYVQINTTLAQNAAATIWNSTAPSSTVISLGSHALANVASTNMSYAWHSVEGYSSFGAYEGNGNADGPFLNMSMDTGMFLMKSIDAARAWMYQHKEFQVNGESNYLLIYSTNILASTSTREIDIVSTGVKFRGADGNLNHAETNIYMAWGGRPMTDGAINQGRAK